MTFRSSVFHRILLRVLFCSSLELLPVRLVLSRDVGFQRMVWVGVGKQRPNGYKDSSNRKCWSPTISILEDIDAETTKAILLFARALNIRMIYLGFKPYSWRQKRILGWDFHLEREFTSGICRIFGAVDTSNPVVNIILYDACGAPRRWIAFHECNFFMNASSGSLRGVPCSSTPGSCHVFLRYCFYSFCPVG